MNDRSNDAILARVDALVSEGRFDEAITDLRQAIGKRRDIALETRLLSVRHRAFIGIDHPPGPDPWPTPVPDPFPPGGLPEVEAADLSAAVVSAALAHHGSLVVRGLIDDERASNLRDVIDRAFAGAARLRDHPDAEAAPDLVPFQPDERYAFGAYERAFANHGSGVLGVDSPSAMFEMTEALDASGMRRVMEDFFGERPAFSVKKTTLRRTAPDALAGWHQDGAFLGTETRALNIWTALSPCGVDAAGLDVVARRFDDLVPTGDTDAAYPWSVSDRTAARYGADDIVRPEFATGDALLFDHMTLHRTGIDPSMTETRYAVEMWFFAPSTYPTEQVPILF